MRLTPEELAARKRRNIALAMALVAFMVLVFLTTLLRMQSNQREAVEATGGGAVAEARP